MGTYLHVFLLRKKTFSSMCNFGCQGPVTKLAQTEYIHTPHHENCDIEIETGALFLNV